MKFLVLLIGQGEVRPWDTQTPEEQGEEMERFGAFESACEAHDGVEILAAEELDSADTAMTTRVRGGRRTIAEGPYAESLAELGGFYLLEAPDRETVMELVQLLPEYDLQITPAVDPGE